MLRLIFAAALACAPTLLHAEDFAGVASFYGSESGNRTASGECFHESGMTAAHRSLPFGTLLRVKHGERSVIVKVNDRGPFVRRRVLDLSTAAAAAIGISPEQGIGVIYADIIGRESIWPKKHCGRAR